MAKPQAGDGRGCFLRFRNLTAISKSSTGKLESVKSPSPLSRTTKAFPAMPSLLGHRNPTFQFRRRPSSSHYVELNIMRLMISKKLCGVKISLCRERGFILHIIFIMIPTNLRYFCLATFSFLESPGIPDSLKYFFHRKIHFCILRCCVDICMPQPIRNRTQIVFCL